MTAFVAKPGKYNLDLHFSNVLEPPDYVQKELLALLASKTPDDEGYFEIKRSDGDLSATAIKALVSYAAGEINPSVLPASETFFDGFLIKTDYVNGFFEFVGINCKIPTGMGLLVNKATESVAFAVDKSF